MEVFFFAFISLLLLIPIIYFIPLGINFRVKLIVLGSSFILALLGLTANLYMTLWKSLAIILLLALVVTFILERKIFPKFVYASHADKGANDEELDSIKDANIFDTENVIENGLDDQNSKMDDLENQSMINEQLQKNENNGGDENQHGKVEDDQPHALTKNESSRGNTGAEDDKVEANKSFIKGSSSTLNEDDYIEELELGDRNLELDEGLSGNDEKNQESLLSDFDETEKFDKEHDPKEDTIRNNLNELDDIDEVSYEETDLNEDGIEELESIVASNLESIDETEEDDEKEKSNEEMIEAEEEKTMLSDLGDNDEIHDQEAENTSEDHKAEIKEDEMLSDLGDLEESEITKGATLDGSTGEIEEKSHEEEENPDNEEIGNEEEMLSNLGDLEESEITEDATIDDSTDEIEEKSFEEEENPDREAEMLSDLEEIKKSDAFDYDEETDEPAGKSPEEKEDETEIDNNQSTKQHEVQYDDDDKEVLEEIQIDSSNEISELPTESDKEHSVVDEEETAKLNNGHESESEDKTKAAEGQSIELQDDSKPLVSQREYPRKTKVQQQMLHMMFSQIQLMRNEMDSKSYEEFIIEHLNPNMPDQDYYSFAQLLIEHYLHQREMKKLSDLLVGLQKRFEKYPILMQEITYMIEKYR